MSTVINKRALAQLTDERKLLAQRARNSVAAGKITNWADFNARFPTIQLLCDRSLTAFTYANISSELDRWVSMTEAFVSNPVEVTRVKASDYNDKSVTYGSISLYPEQIAVHEGMWQVYKSGHLRAALNPGGTGSGKTAIALSLIARSVAAGEHTAMPNCILRQVPYLVLTKRSVVEDYRNEAIRMGLLPLLNSGKLVITSHSELSSSMSVRWMREELNSVTNEYEVQWVATATPIITIVDEAQAFNNPSTTQTRALRALCRSELPTFVAFFTATAWATVNDCETFVLAAKNFDYAGMTITPQSFKSFASLVAEEPSKVNDAAMGRLSKILSPLIINTPYVRWKSRAVNNVLLCEFANDRDREIYQQAEETYLERISKLGKNTQSTRFYECVIKNEFRKAAEPCRIPFMFERLRQNYTSGTKATVIGCAYKDSIVRMLKLCLESGIPRKEISVIWGGTKKIDVSKLYDKDQLFAITQRVMAGEQLPAEELKRVEASLLFIEAGVRTGATDAEHRELQDFLAANKLVGNQTPERRQIEKDNFQDGVTKICLFTLAAGGVGLSLDQRTSKLLPREGFFGPVWSGHEGKQALGRLVRRPTVQELVYQYLCCMRGTLEETNVMPVMLSKFKCFSKINNSDFDFSNPPVIQGDFDAVAVAQDDESQLGFNTEDKDEEDEIE